jgi:hypothetical protein
MKSSKILAEIRQTREDLAHETGYDLRRLFAYVREREREATAREVKFVSAAPRKRDVSYVLREEPRKKK